MAGAGVGLSWSPWSLSSSSSSSTSIPIRLSMCDLIRRLHPHTSNSSSFSRHNLHQPHPLLLLQGQHLEPSCSLVVLGLAAPLELSKPAQPTIHQFICITHRTSSCMHLHTHLGSRAPSVSGAVCANCCVSSSMITDIFLLPSCLAWSCKPGPGQQRPCPHQPSDSHTPHCLAFPL